MENLTNDKEIVLEQEEIVREVTMTGLEANLYAIILFIPIFIILGLPFIWIWGLKAFKMGGKLFIHNGIFFLIILLVGIIIHEGLHGITWAKYCKAGFKSIQFGIKWSYLTPYCHCKEPLQVNHYRIGGLMPGLILGIIPSVIAIITGNSWLIWFGLLFTGAAGGDIMVLWQLRKYNNRYLMQDHPDEIGFIVKRKRMVE